jgi:hypothetical protein
MSENKNDKRTLIAIGYWYSDSEPDLPKPQNFVDPGIDDGLKTIVLEYLANGKRLHDWMGYSYCRFNCGTPAHQMGNACITDGKFIWPEGLTHYIKQHSIWLPELFITHLRSDSKSKTKTIEVDEMTFGTYEWWKTIQKL